MRPIHHVFDIGYSSVVRELRSEAMIFDPLSERSLVLKHAIWDTGATSTALNSSNGNSAQADAHAHQQPFESIR